MAHSLEPVPYCTLLNTSTGKKNVMSTVVNACGTINTSYGMKMKMGMGMMMGVGLKENCMEKRDLYTVNYISNHHPLYRNQRRVDVDVDKVGDGMESRGG